MELEALSAFFVFVFDFDFDFDLDIDFDVGFGVDSELGFVSSFLDLDIFRLGSAGAEAGAETEIAETEQGKEQEAEAESAVLEAVLTEHTEASSTIVVVLFAAGALGRFLLEGDNSGSFLLDSFLVCFVSG